MMMSSCPIDAARVDQTLVRIVAGLVSLVALASFASTPTILLLLLAFDFLLRASGRSPCSPLYRLAQLIARMADCAPEMVNAGPKLFASRLGFVLALAALICNLSGAQFLQQLLCAVLVFCAGLEALFSVCLGCYIYPLVARVGTQRK